MAAEFPYKCSCGATGLVRSGKDEIKSGMTFMSDCESCTNAIIIQVIEINRDGQPIKYTVQARETEILDY